MIQIRWTEQAVRDLEKIKSFIARDSPAYALAVVAKLYDAWINSKPFLIQVA